MHARVSTFEGGRPERFEENRRLIREEVIPEAQKMPGFKGGHWLGDRTSGKASAVTLWESERALRDSEEAANKLRKESSQKAGVRPVAVESYEVAVQHGEGPSETGEARFALMTRGQAQPDKIEEGIRAFKEQAPPALEKVEGFKGVSLLVDRKTAKVMVVGRFRSEKERDTAEATVIGALRKKIAERFGSTGLQVETYEIMAEARAGTRVGV